MLLRGSRDIVVELGVHEVVKYDFKILDELDLFILILRDLLLLLLELLLEDGDGHQLVVGKHFVPELGVINVGEVVASLVLGGVECGLLQRVDALVVLELLLLAGGEDLVDIFVLEVLVAAILPVVVVHEGVGAVLEEVLDLLRVLLELSECPQLQSALHCDVLVVRVLVERALAEQRLLHPQFLRGSLEHLLLVGLRRDQPVYLHFELLPDSVRARDRLQIVLRVPVRVEDYHHPR